MIQAAITKRLPVFAGGNEGAVFTALFSFPCTVCNNRGIALSASRGTVAPFQIRGKLLVEPVARNASM